MKLVAIVAGVLLVGPPVAAFNLWLQGLADRQGRAELEFSARRTMALAESRIDRVAAVLGDLAARGVDSCRPANLEAMRQATFATTPMKEMSIVASDGRTLCTEFGVPFEQRKLKSSERLKADSNMLLQVVQIGERAQPLVRIVRAGAAGNGIAAVVPAELFVAQISAHGGALSGHTRLTTTEGTLIAEAGGAAHETEPQERLTSRISSARYPLHVTVSLSGAPFAASQEHFMLVGLVTSGAVALVILIVFAGFRFLAPKRTRDNPIAEIERALAAGEFVPYYQPIVDIRSGRLRGAEVLVRWKKPDGTLIPPATFIPLVESSGLIVDMTRALMRRVVEEAGSAFGRRPHVRIGFNLTARHFADEQIVSDVGDIFGDSPIRMSQIVLEVTERQPLDNLTETRRVVAALQGLGVRIAIDDVGTGHSGLSYMLKLGVDIIKIDKMFIDSIGIDRNSNAIIETLIDLAQNMRMEVVAEGVENFEQVVHLRDLGIRAAQGFVFAPPLPGTSFLQLIEAIDLLKGAAPTAETGMRRRSLAA